MLKEWLCWLERDPSPYSEFRVIDVTEIQPPTDVVINHIRDLLIHARLDPKFLQDAAKYLGWDKVQALAASSQPKGFRMRRGEFGEVLSSAMLQQFHGYTIPVQKLRFAISSDQSLPGTDVIVLRLDSQRKITEVGFVESKLRTGSDTGAAVQGYKQLKHDYEQQQSDMLHFVAQRLYERNDLLKDEFMKYMLDREDRRDRDSFQLFLIWEQPGWSETVLQNLEDNDVELDRLTLHVTLVQNLGQLTEKLFRSIGVDGAVDDE